MVKFCHQLGFQSPSNSRRSKRKRSRGKKKSFKREMKTQQAESAKKKRKNNNRKRKMSKENFKTTRRHWEGIYPDSVPASSRVLRSMKIDNSGLEENRKKAEVSVVPLAVGPALEGGTNLGLEEQKGPGVAPQPVLDTCKLGLREMDPRSLPSVELKNGPFYIVDETSETVLKSDCHSALLDKAKEGILKSDSETTLLDKPNETILKSDCHSALLDKANEGILKSDSETTLVHKANETVLNSDSQTALDKANETKINSTSEATLIESSVSSLQPDSIQADESLIVLDETGDTTLFFMDTEPELPSTTPEQGTKRKSSEMESPQPEITPKVAGPSGKKRRKKKSVKPIECITLDSDSDTNDVILVPNEISTIELSDDESRSPCRNVLLNPLAAAQGVSYLVPLPYLSLPKSLITPKKKSKTKKSSQQSKKKVKASEPPAPKKAAPVAHPAVGKPRPIAIDGANVAFGHGLRRKFSSEGIKICIDYFLARGHTTVKVFIPQFRKYHPQTSNSKLLEELEDKGYVVFTPSRRVEKKLIVSYEDRMILDYAAQSGAVVITRDNYKDLFDEKPEWADAIKQRLLMYTWVDDMIMFPDDPMGKSGPSLDVFLRFPPEETSETNQN